MSKLQDEIDQLQIEISLSKVKVKEAIHEGQIFEEVKKIILQIKELVKKLASRINADKKCSWQVWKNFIYNQKIAAVNN